MTIRLIVNADDYGHSPAVSTGIRKAHLDGIVTTTTTMMNYPDAVPSLEIARDETPRLGVGVHLIVTEGRPVRPVEKVPSLVRGTGTFYPLREIYDVFGHMKINELRDEWRAQIEKFLQTGHEIDHFDSHHHAAYIFEDSLRLLFDLAEEYDVPIRHPYTVFALWREKGVPNPDKVARFKTFADPMMAAGRVRYPDCAICDFYNLYATVEHLLSIIDCLQDGTTNELMVHPGLLDDEIMRGSTYNTMRLTELGVVTDARVRERIEARGIELITFREM